MNIERNCQSCKYYKDGYCENLELNPKYPMYGCNDFENKGKKEPMVPVSELMNLYNEMYKVNAKTDGERDVLYTCRCMLADVIESYSKEKNEK